MNTDEHASLLSFCHKKLVFLGWQRRSPSRRRWLPYHGSCKWYAEGIGMIFVVVARNMLCMMR